MFRFSVAVEVVDEVLVNCVMDLSCAVQDLEGAASKVKGSREWQKGLRPARNFQGEVFALECPG